MSTVAEVDESGRIPFPGIEHGDRVQLTGESWREGGFYAHEVYEVDDVSFHRPVIYDPSGCEWYVMKKTEASDFSVTKAADQWPTQP